VPAAAAAAAAPPNAHAGCIQNAPPPAAELHIAAGTAHAFCSGDGEGGEVGGDGPRAGGGDDGGPGLLQKPLGGLAVCLVAELAGELEHPRRAHGRHPYPSPAPLHLRVSVLGRMLRHHLLLVLRAATGRGGRRRWLLLRLRLPSGCGHDGEGPHERRHPLGCCCCNYAVGGPRRGRVVEGVVLVRLMRVLVGGAPASIGAGAARRSTSSA
jgi:hypothetical protein